MENSSEAEVATTVQRRKSYTVAYKKFILNEIVTVGNMHTVCRDNGLNYQMVAKWKKQSVPLSTMSTTNKRKTGAGRKPILGDHEDVIFEWFADKRARNLPVTRTQIKKFAIESFVAENNNIVFKASNHWLDGFMKRYDMSLRSKSTLFRLEDMEVINRVLSFKSFVDRLDFSQYNLHNCFAMDETAVCYGDYNRTTVDYRGATSVSIQSTGYESEQVTCILVMRLNGEKLPPLVIVKGPTKPIESKYGVWLAFSEKAWSTQAVLRKYIERVVPRISRNGQKALIVWDAASTHRAADMKRYLAQIRVDQVMIPSGTTMYLQSLDVAINKPFKDYVREAVNEYTENRLIRNARGNIVKPKIEEVCSWIASAWNRISQNNINNALKAGYLHPSKVFTATYIYNHEKCGPLISNALQSDPISPSETIVPEDDELELISDSESESETEASE